MTAKPEQATFYLFLQIKDIESYFVVYFHHNNQFKGILQVDTLFIGKTGRKMARTY